MRRSTRSALGVIGVGLAALACAALAGTPPAADASGPGASALAGLVDRWHGARCAPLPEDPSGARCTTPGDARPTLLAATLRPPVDLDGRIVRLRLRVDRLAHLGGLELRVGSGGFEDGFFAFPIPLFADPPFNRIQDGAWTELSVSFATARVEGAPARDAVDTVGVYVTDRGDGPLEIALADLRTPRHPAEGMLSITFDDGTRSHAEVAAPEMARFGLRGTAYVMPDEVGLPGFVTLDELHALQDEHGWDVAAHHGVPFTDFDRAGLERTILDVQRYLRENGFSRGAGHLAYPLGKQEPEVVRPLVREHFATARVAGAGPETLPPADPYLLRAVNVLHTTSPEEIGAVARRARAHGEWAILMFHLLVEEPRMDLEYGIGDFRRALALIRESGVEVLPVSEAWERAAALDGAGTPRREP